MHNQPLEYAAAETYARTANLMVAGGRVRLVVPGFSKATDTVLMVVYGIISAAHTALFAGFFYNGWYALARNGLLSLEMISLLAVSGVGLEMAFSSALMCRASWRFAGLPRIVEIGDGFVYDTRRVEWMRSCRCLAISDLEVCRLEKVPNITYGDSGARMLRLTFRGRWIGRRILIRFARRDAAVAEEAYRAFSAALQIAPAAPGLLQSDHHDTLTPAGDGHA